MAGSNKGVAALIKAMFPVALYFYCASHRLNLCVQKTCSVQMVHNSMDSINDISYFFNLSPKRQGCLEQYVQKHELSVAKEDVSLEDENTNENDPGEDTISNKNKNCSRSKLIDVCRTRWVARIDGMGQFEKLLPYAVGELEKMHLNKKNVYNRETSVKAGPTFLLMHII